jgi:fluoride exporter
VNWLLVAAGAGVGAPLRYLLDRAVQERHGSPFPWGTFAVNVSGSLALGVAAGLASAGSGAYAVVGTGLCGAFTTFSTFSYELLRLAERGRAVLAAFYAGGSVLAGLAALALGLAAGRGLGG